MSGTHSAPRGGKRKSASQCSAKVIGGVAMAARKSRTAQPQNSLNVSGRPASCQQSARHPQIHAAPVRLCKALRDVPAPYPGLVNLPGLCAGQARWNGPLPRRCRHTGIRFGIAWDSLLASRLQQAIGVAGQTSSGVDDFYPRRIALAVAALRLLIGEASESAQMMPICTGAVATIQMRQLPAHGSSDGRWQRCGTDMHPSLPMARAGLKHNTRLMAVSAHRRQHCGIGTIQVDQDIAGVPVLSIRVEVHVTAFAVAYPQETYRRQVRQLRGRPQPFSGKRPLGQTVDQSNEVKFARHGRQLPTDSLRSEHQPQVKHAPNSAIELGCRTINSQRVVSSVLTRCLSQGAHFNSSFPSLYRGARLAAASVSHTLCLTRGL
jgi:hypothetical protein